MIARSAFLAAAICACATVQADDDLDTDPVFQKCPAAASFYRQLERKRNQEAPKLAAPKLPLLRKELLKMEEADQKARTAFRPTSRSFETDWQPVAKIDAHNLPRIKSIVAHSGFPTAGQVGLEGVMAAWLLVQHADNDPAFQERVLHLIEPRVGHDGIRAEDVALLTDRVLRAKDKPQRYGSQFWKKDGRYVPQPIEDPDHVDERRATVNLMPMADYSCLINAQNAATAP